MADPGERVTGRLEQSPGQSPEQSAALRQLIQSLRHYAEASDRVVDAAAQSHGLHRTDLRALTILMQRQAAGTDTSPSDLGRLLNLTSASTTALVDRLVANGHAQRAPSTTDRRRVMVTHTQSATVDGARIFGPMARYLSGRLAGFTAEQMHAAAQVVAAATDALNAFDAESTEGHPATAGPYTVADPT